MKKLVFLTIALILAVSTVSAQDGQILKKNFNIEKGVPTIRLIGTTPILNFGTIGGKIDFYNSGVSDLTLTHSANTLTLAGGDLALGANNLTMTGSIGVTGSRVTKIWATNIESTNVPSLGGIGMARIMQVTKTIGAVGVTGCDYNFATAANTTQQVINLGAIVPAFARIISVDFITDVLWAGTSITAFTVEAGNASSGAQFFADTDLILAGAIGQPAVGAGYTLLAISKDPTTVYVSAAPTGGNWSALTAGKGTVVITYIARTL